MHLLHHLRAMLLDGDFTDTEFSRDLFIQQTCHYELHNFSFPSCQRLKARAYIRQVCSLRPCDTVLFDRLVYAVKKLLVTKGLGEEIDGARLECLNGHWNVSVARDEDDRDEDFGLS